MGQIEQLYGRRPAEPFGGPARPTGGAARSEAAADDSSGGERGATD